jgi:exopolysaccharide biosynthesis polyprenyl glycosylphosphotransferase
VTVEQQAEIPAAAPARERIVYPVEPLREREAPGHRRGWLVRRMLLGADVTGLTLAFVVAEGTYGTRGDWPEMIAFVATLPAWTAVAQLYGLYSNDEERAVHSTADDLLTVFHLITVVSWLLFVVGWLTGIIDPNLPKLVLFWALSIALVVSLRGLARTFAHRSDAYVQNALVVGAGEVGQSIAKKLLAHPEYGVRVIGFVDDRPRERDPGLEDLAIVGTLDEIPELVYEYDVSRVVIAFSNVNDRVHLALLRTLKDHDVQVDVVPRLFEVVGARTHLHTIEGLPLLGLPPLRLDRPWQALKRAMDIVLAGIGLIVLLPLLVAIAVAIKVTSPGPVFFRQVRMGYHDRPFAILKFRTMVRDAEELKPHLAHLNAHLADDPRMFKVEDDPRVTPVGRVLRRWALDELPQLVNVLLGEMSLVGPRPLIPEEDSHVQAWARRRHSLKPGVTGPWQALGASDIPFEEMVRLDYVYITNWSLYEDVKWLWRTLPSLVRGRHAY